MPPVEETFGFVEDAIETQLDWLNAPSGAQKSLSFALLALFPVVLFGGTWRHSRRLLAVSAGLMVVVYFLMRRREVLMVLDNALLHRPTVRCKAEASSGRMVRKEVYVPLNRVIVSSLLCSF